MMEIHCRTVEDFGAIIYELVIKGLSFTSTADIQAGTFKIVLTGGY